MKTIMIIIIILVSVAAWAKTPNAITDCSDIYIDIYSSDFPSQYDQMIEQYPNSIYLQYLYGIYFYLRGYEDEALLKFIASTSGQSYCEMSKYYQALSCINVSGVLMEYDKTNAYVYAIKGINIVTNLEIEYDQTSVSGAYYNLGRCAADLSKIDEALWAYTRAFQIDPSAAYFDDWSYYNTLTMLTAQSNQYELSFNIWNQAEQYYPMELY